MSDAEEHRPPPLETGGRPAPLVGGDQLGGSRPVPDPTVLTTQALYREVEQLRVLLTQRMQGMDEIERQKLRRVEQQFELIERQRVEQKQDMKAALDAALAAQKDAVREQTIASERAIAKSEAATTKQLEQLIATINTATDGLRRDIDDLKGRVTVVESLKLGSQQAREGLNAGATLAIGTLGLLVAILTVAVVVVLAIG